MQKMWYARETASRTLTFECENFHQESIVTLGSLKGTESPRITLSRSLWSLQVFLEISSSIKPSTVNLGAKYGILIDVGKGEKTLSHLLINKGYKKALEYSNTPRAR